MTQRAILGEMLNCDRVVTAALEQNNQRLYLNCHTYSLTIIVAGHTHLPFKGLLLELLMHLHLSIFLRAGFCTVKAMIITFLLIVSS